MNQSSLYSFDDSSIWDPKVIRQLLSIPEDQLNILNTIPGWTKTQDNDNTFGIGKDSSLGNSQFQDLVGTTQNSQGIWKQNIDLFNKHLEDRKELLKTYKRYRENFTRSKSLFDISKTSENLFGGITGLTLKRTLSSPVLRHSSDIFHVKYLDKGLRGGDSSPARNSSSDFNKKELLICRSVEYSAVSNINKTASDPKKLLIDSEVMEVFVPGMLTQLTKNISSDIQNIPSKELNIEATEEKSCLSSQCVTEHENNLKDQFVTSVDKCLKNDNPTVVETNKLVESDVHTSCDNNKVESSIDIVPKVAILAVATENVKMPLNGQEIAEAHVPISLNIEATKEKSYLSSRCITEHENNLKDQLVTSVDKCLENNSTVVETNKLVESYVHTSCENNKVELSIEKETIPVVAIPAIATENVKMPLNGQETVEAHVPISCENSNSYLHAVKEIISMDVGLAANGNIEVNLNDKEVNEITKPSEECLELLDNPSKEQASVSGKRKLECKNRKSKKRRSEQKQSSVKIRSIKKTGEVIYSADDVETMLDILKEFL